MHGKVDFWNKLIKHLMLQFPNDCAAERPNSVLSFHYYLFLTVIFNCTLQTTILNTLDAVFLSYVLDSINSTH